MNMELLTVNLATDAQIQDLMSLNDRCARKYLCFARNNKLSVLLLINS